MNRFYLIVAMAFVTTFVGVSWAARGFPVGLFSQPARTIQQPAGIVQPLPALVDSTFGDEHAKQYERKMWEARHTAQSDGDPALDKLRLDALQAANAYAMSPCGDITKLNLIEALTAYTRAWQKKIDCPRPQHMLMFCGDAKVKAASETFSTPLDQRVHSAFHEAFEQHGIVQEDFPKTFASICCNSPVPACGSMSNRRSACPGRTPASAARDEPGLVPARAARASASLQTDRGLSIAPPRPSVRITPCALPRCG